jgi:hypothetical protein
LEEKRMLQQFVFVEAARAPQSGENAAHTDRSIRLAAARFINSTLAWSPAQPDFVNRPSPVATAIFDNLELWADSSSIGAGFSRFLIAPGDRRFQIRLALVRLIGRQAMLLCAGCSSKALATE